MAVAGTQRVITRAGPVPVKKLVGEAAAVDLWDGESFVPVHVAKLGAPVKLLEVLLSDGTSVRCTEDHEFHVPSFRNEGHRKPVPAKQVHRGLRLARVRFPVTDPNVELPHAYAQGAYSVFGREGDGFKTLTCRNAAVAANMRASVGEVLDVTNLLARAKSHVPTGASLRCKREWLSGLLDAVDAKQPDDSGLTVTFRDQEFIREVGDLLACCGIRCSLRFKSGDVAAMSFSPDQADRLIRLVRAGIRPDVEGDTQEGNTKYTVLSAVSTSNLLLRKAKRAGQPVTVQSVRKLEKPTDAYSCRGALVV